MHDIDELDDVLAQLSQLAPPEADGALTAGQALERFNQQRRLTSIMSRRRSLLTGAVAVLLIAFVIAFPPARAAASQFLGLFRVQKFAPISISPAQLAVLEELAGSGLYPGEFEMIDEIGASRAFDSAATAIASLQRDSNGWRYRGLRQMPALGAPSRVDVQSGMVGRLTIDLESSRAILDAVGVDPMVLPDSLDGNDIHATVYPALAQSWDGVTLVQMPSPEIVYPEDVDPSVIGEAILRFLGMSDGEAYRLAQNIDWTSTLLMPIPTDLATFSEVRIGDTTGIGIEALDADGAALLWQSSGMLYLLIGDGTAADLALLVDLAN